MSFKSKSKTTNKGHKISSFFRDKNITISSTKVKANILVQRVIETILIVSLEYILALGICTYGIPIANAYVAGAMGITGSSNFLDVIAYYLFPCVFVTLCFFALMLLAGRKLFQIIHASFEKSIQKQKEKLTNTTE